jgi:hypothetical protein
MKIIWFALLAVVSLQSNSLPPSNRRQHKQSPLIFKKPRGKKEYQRPLQCINCLQYLKDKQPSSEIKKGE